MSEPAIIDGLPVSRPRGATAEAFACYFSEPLEQVLDLKTWYTGSNLVQEYQRITEAIEQAVRTESEHQQRVRACVVEKLATLPAAPPQAGYWSVPLEEIRTIHQRFLFNGATECCDGTVQIHESLALTIYQIGVCLVSYAGNQGSWSTRLFRRDLTENRGDPVAETLALLQARAQRSGLNQPDRRDGLSELAERAIMSYAELAVLVHHAQAPWKLGHGSPAPYELLSGAGNPDMMIRSVRLMRHLIEEHQRFVFVASEPSDRAYLTIGQALRPCEYAIVGTLDQRIRRYVEGLRFSQRVTVDDTWDDKPLTPELWVHRFLEEVAPQVVVGVYRASPWASPQLFYAHGDHAHLAARIALADSVLLAHRGFPALIDLADRTCASIYGGGNLQEIADTAYARVGAGTRYMSERHNRPE
ncbi:MAG: hypothetical protein RMJ56_03270 [Gemmataceae bacterium]|nr:hypothetical protein [Gemmata sp.]MDW8196609.1 hypothetical protein [Gemmataceae bacterium]